MKIKNNIERYLINQDASIIETMKIIDRGEERTGFLVDPNLKLLKVVTDGDIRRAILKGASLSDPVKNIHDRKPYVVKENENYDDARMYLSKRITVVPIVNEENCIKGMLRLHDVQPFINIRSRDVCILGLGYVGLTLALCLSDAGFSVIGYDTDDSLIGKIKNKEASFHENGIERYLNKHVGQNFRLTNTSENVLADIYIITVGTPIKKNSMTPNINYIEIAAKAIGNILKKNDLVILRSTVPIGITRNVVLPILEEVSGLKVGEEFYLAFCPERTAEGKALEELKNNPQIVGGFCPLSTEIASRLFNENTHTVIDAGSLEAAEMCKLVDNTYRDTIFAYANQMASLCEKIGLNLNDIIRNVNLGYNRNFIPLPSPGVGGACLSKDPYILMSNFEEQGLDASVTKASRQINEMAPKSIFDRCNHLLSKVKKDLRNAKIFIIGFAFKGEPETSDLRGSTTIWFLEYIKKKGATNIYGYDPIVKPEDINQVGVVSCSMKEGFLNADAVFIMNNHKSYSNLRIFRLLETTNQPALFFDGWQIFNPSEIRGAKGIIYAGTGVG